MVVKFPALNRHAIIRHLRENRSRRIVLTVGVGWGGRAVSALAQFVAVRVLTTMLGVDGFGAWAVITGLLAWFMLADFGLGAALQNYISASKMRDESPLAAIRGTVSFLWRSLSLLILLLALIASWIGPFLLEGFTTINRMDAILGFFIFGAVATAIGSSSVILKILFAEHRGYVAHLITAIGALLGLAGLVIVGQTTTAHRFAWALIANYLPLCLISWVFLWRRLRHGPLKDLWHWSDAVQPLRGQAGHFLLFAVLSAMVLNIDYIILARTVSPADVATYAVMAKLYGLVFFVFSSVLQAYWPLSAEAFQRGDVDGLHRLAIRCIGLGMLTVIGASLGLFVLHDHIATLLSPHQPLILPKFLIPFFAGYWLLRVWSDTFSMLVLSAGRAMFLCMVVPVQATISLGLGIWGASAQGLPGFMLGLSASFLLTVVWGLPFYVHHLTRNRIQEG